MAEPDNIVLHYLRRFDEKLDAVAADVHELRIRTTSLETLYASLSRRADRIGGDVERIKRRLDLIEAEPDGGAQ